jgi:ABC-type multidrug transport system fused ATPase/permease subunit
MNFIKKYYKYLKPHSWKIFGVFLSGLAFVAFSGVAFWMAADFLQAIFSGDIVVPPKPEGGLTFITLADHLKHYSATVVATDSPVQTLQRAILFIVAAFLMKNVALYMQSVLAASVEQHIAKSMRDDLYNSLMSQDLTFFHHRKTGDLVAAGINDITALNAGLAESFAKLLRDPLNIILFLTLLLSISWQMTLGAMVIAPIAGLITGFAGSSLKRKSKRTQSKVGVVTSRLNEVLYGMRIVQAYGGEEHEQREFDKVTEDHFREALGRERLRRLVPPLEEMVGVVVIAIILIIAGGKVLSGQWLNPDDFVRFLIMMFGLLTPLVSLAEVQARLKVAEGAASRVFDLMEEKFEIDEVNDPKPIDDFKSEIKFDNIGLVYGDERNAALENISISIKPGEKVVFIGKSGSGKSSLLNMLPRFYDPSSGEISIDGENLKEFSLDDLRRMFGIVTQEVTLFHDTVFKNIAYGQKNITLDQVRLAAKQAHADEFIEEMEEGYETNLGNLGERLSGGQRQRLSIARALIQNPKILLFDEPTSSLDGDVAEEIQHTLNEIGIGRTVITASHRLTSIQNNERIILMDSGKIVADGLHDDLYRNSSLYRDLYDRQAKVA